MHARTRPGMVLWVPGRTGRVGIPGGVLPSHPPTARGAQPAKRAPEAQHGLEWVGWAGVMPARGRRRGRVCTTLRARSVLASQALPVHTLANAASWPIRARLHPLFSKVSQNHEVSPKSVQKAYHSPYFQNGSQMSPLDISGIPFSAAFSHKELMGHFDRYSDFIVKMTKCRPDVHWISRAKWSSDTPTSHAASCLCATLLI